MTHDEVRHYFQQNDTYAQHMGIELLEVTSERGVAIMPFEAAQRNGMGHAHGGAIFGLMDMAFGAASNAAGMACVNMQSSVSYLAPGKKGPLRAEAVLVHPGRRVVTYDITVTDGAGTLVAKATITGYITNKPLVR